MRCPPLKLPDFSGDFPSALTTFGFSSFFRYSVLIPETRREKNFKDFFPAEDRLL
jgi:hypothetical protein